MSAAAAAPDLNLTELDGKCQFAVDTVIEHRTKCHFCFYYLKLDIIKLKEISFCIWTQKWVTLQMFFQITVCRSTGHQIREYYVKLICCAFSSEQDQLCNLWVLVKIKNRRPPCLKCIDSDSRALNRVTLFRLRAPVMHRSHALDASPALVHRLHQCRKTCIFSMFPRNVCTFQNILF